MKIGFIGCGNMGGALARAVSLAEGVEIYLSDFDENKVSALAAKTGGSALSTDGIFCSCDYIFLGVKPGVIPSVLDGGAEEIKKNPRSVIISMAAGVKIEKIEKSVGASHPIIRIMPNTPVAAGLGMTLYSKNEAVCSEAEEEFLRFMAHSGIVDYIPEELIDAACAVSGCGPAFVYMFINALAKGGERQGLPANKALLYAAQTVKGAAEMLLTDGRSPTELRDAVCSPGGSTIEGVHSLEKDGLDGTVMNAIEAAYKRTLELGK